jgi:hypothetical protein
VPNIRATIMWNLQQGVSVYLQRSFLRDCVWIPQRCLPSLRPVLSKLCGAPGCRSFPTGRMARIEYPELQFALLILPNFESSLSYLHSTISARHGQKKC